MIRILFLTVFMALMISPVWADQNGGKPKIDVDGDGSISKSEFLDAHAKRFEKIDTDGSGTLSREELKASMEKRKEHRKEKHEERKEKKKDAVDSATESKE